MFLRSIHHFAPATGIRHFATATKPKKPPNAYASWFKASVAGLREANPTLEYKDIMRTAGVTWRGLESSEKEEYIADYKKKMKKYNKKIKPVSNKPKRPLGAYFRFMADRRSALIEEKPELAKSVAECAKALGAEWGVLDEDEKQRYIDEAAEEMSKFPKAEKKVSTEPKRPLTAYFLFMKERRPALLEERPELRPTVAACAKVLGAEWTALDDADKQSFIDEAAAAKEAFDEEQKPKQKPKQKQKQKQVEESEAEDEEEDEE